MDASGYCAFCCTCITTTTNKDNFMPNNPKTYYSYAALLNLYAKLSGWCAVCFLLIASIGQWHSGRFPAYYDLLFAVAIPLVAFVIIAGLVLLSDYLYPLKVSSAGLQSYNCLGRYDKLDWQQIVAVEEGEKFGLKCLYVDINAFRPRFVIPLWLHELNDFCKTVEQCAGQNNPLTVALQKATH
jgi:hypothetical protein